MTPPVPLPYIAEEDYDAFWRMLHPDLPGPYDEWLLSHRLEAENLQFLGQRAEPIPIDPREFADYCRATDKPISVDTLKQLAIEKMHRRGY